MKLVLVDEAALTLVVAMTEEVIDDNRFGAQTPVWREAVRLLTLSPVGEAVRVQMPAPNGDLIQVPDMLRALDLAARKAEQERDLLRAAFLELLEAADESWPWIGYEEEGSKERYRLRAAVGDAAEALDVDTLASRVLGG